MPEAKKLITKSGKVRWIVRYRDAHRRSREKWFERKADANRFAIKVAADLQAGHFIDPQMSRVPFKEWAERWFRTTTPLKPKTREGYESLLRLHILPHFGGRAIGSISHMDVSEWVADLRRSLSPSRVTQAYRVASLVFKAAVASGSLARSPCIGIRMPTTQRREPRCLTHLEVDRLASEVGAPFNTLVYVLAYGGLRFGEAAALRIRRWNPLHSRLSVEESLARVNGDIIFGPTKTHQARTIVLPQRAAVPLTQHIETQVRQGPDALIFTARNGSPLHGSNFRRSVWYPAIHRAGFPGLRVHDLRHTCVALLIAAGRHVEEIKRHLGHSSIVVTLDRYGHIYDSAQKQMAAALDEAYEAEAASSRGVIVGLELDDAFGGARSKGETASQH